MKTKQNELVLPPAFSGPAPLMLYTRYGDPRVAGWENKWITTWHVQQLHPWFPGKDIRIHKHFWPLLADAFLELERLGLHLEINSYHRCLQVFQLQESPILSVHSWGAAIDLNETDNPTGSNGTWSRDFINVMTNNGIFCGQNWTGTKEPMHFALADGD